VADRASGRFRLVAPAVAALVAVVGFAAAQPERNAATPDAAGHVDPEPYTLRRAPGALECVGADGSVVMRIALEGRDFSFGHRAVAMTGPRGAMVVVSVPAADAGEARSGRVFAFDAGRLPPVWTVEGDGANGLFGSALALVPDADADGAADLLVGAPGEGRAHLVSGADGSRLRALAGDASEAFGWSVGARRTDDGAVEHAVGSVFRDGAGNLRERLWSFDAVTGELLSKAPDEGAPIIRLAGDLDWSGEVDAADLARLLRAVGRVTPRGGVADPSADLNADGVVDRADLDLLLANFGATGPARVGDDPAAEANCLICPNGQCFDPIFNNCDETGGGDPGPDDDGDGVGGKEGTGATGGGSGSGGGGDGDDGGDTSCSVTISNPPRAIGVWAPNDADGDDDDTNDRDDLPRLTASGSDPGGTYTWEIVQSSPEAGGLKFVDVDENDALAANEGPTVYLQGTGASAALNDVQVKVTYTTADGSCSETDMVELTVIAVALSVRTAGAWSAENGINPDPLHGEPTLGLVTPLNPNGTTGFWHNVEIRAELTPCVAFGGEVGFRQLHQGWAIMRTATGAWQTDSLSSCNPGPGAANWCDDSPTLEFQDVGVDLAENCAVFMVDGPGIVTGGGSCPPNAEGQALALCNRFRSFVEIDGFRASDTEDWWSRSEVKCFLGTWITAADVYGNAVGVGPGEVCTNPDPLFAQAQVEPDDDEPIDFGALLNQIEAPSGAERMAAHMDLEIRLKAGQLTADEREQAWRKLSRIAQRRQDAYPFDAPEYLAIRLLGKLKDPRAIPLLINRVADEFPRFVLAHTRRAPAAQALVDIGVPAIGPIIASAPRADDREWRSLSGALLGIDRLSAGARAQARLALRRIELAPAPIDDAERQQVKRAMRRLGEFLATPEPRRVPVVQEDAPPTS